jgi:hypothetical protein
MKNLNPFFVIGTIGMIVISGLHIFLATLLSDPSVHYTFFVAYPVFIGFMAIGFAEMKNEEKKLALIRVNSRQHKRKAR